MYHSVIIGDINTWDDWHIAPTSRPVINPPEVKTEYVEIPGADGALDYTEVLSGIKYKNRTGSWEFVVINDYQDWNILYQTILSYIHGKRLRVVLEDDPQYYYNGRLSLNSWTSSEQYSTVTIDYVLEPYKHPADSTGSFEWLWNDMSFDRLYVIQYGPFDVDRVKYRNIINESTEDITLSITATSDMDVFYYGEVFSLFGGIVNNSIVIRPGDNRMSFNGNGRVTIDYSAGKRL